MNATELVARIEANFPSQQGLFRRHCQTGEEYVTIGSERPPIRKRRVKLIDGEPIPGVVRDFALRTPYPNEAIACEALLSDFNRYVGWWMSHHAGEPRPTVYWRYLPPYIYWRPDEFERRNCPRLGFLRTRLALSNRPVVYPDDEAYCAAGLDGLEGRIRITETIDGEERRFTPFTS